MIEMIFIIGGTFSMGSTGGDTDEFPVHPVFLHDFLMSKYTITQKDWLDQMGSLPAAIYDKNYNYPITEISWYEAIAFCNKLSLSEGFAPCYSGHLENIVCNFEANDYRLPTEAQWEYAAHGGANSQNYLYSGSNDLDEVGWYASNSDKMLHPVGQKKANESGIYDMSGNVYQYCWDIYGPYPSDLQINPTGPTSSQKNPYQVLRGGDCFGLPYRQRSTSRWRYRYMGYRHDFIGFRIVRSDKAVR